MPDLADRYQKDSSVISREIAGEIILVPIRQSVGDFESIFTLNETAALIWGLLDGEKTLAEIRDRVVSEYDVSPQQAQDDLFELVQRLGAIQAIVRV
jgi:hypothetical protein